MSSVARQSGQSSLGEISRLHLWFGLLGGALAWTAHLLLAYTVAEFGCVSTFKELSYLGISAVAWLLIGITAIALLVASAATLVAYRSNTRMHARLSESVTENDPRAYVAFTGFITSALFTLTIVVESVPIFYYLRSC